MSYTPERPDRMSPQGRFMSILHLGMGTVFIIIGIIVLYTKQFGSIALEGWKPYGLGALLIFYGGFRLIRGLGEIRRR